MVQLKSGFQKFVSNSKRYWEVFLNSGREWKESDDSLADVKQMADEWVRLAGYEFKALGLDGVHQEMALDAGHVVSKSILQIGREIVEAHKNGVARGATETLFDAIMLERVVVHFLPVDQLKLRMESISRRFQSLVGRDKFDQLFPPAVPERTVSAEEMRAELDFMLRETMYVYMMTPLRPQSRGRLLWYCTRPFLVITLVMVFCSWLVAMKEGRVDQFATLMFIPVFGAMGAMLSLQQRVENLPNRGDTVRNVLALESGRDTLWTTSLAGALFAVILNLIFAGEIIEGNLFPTFHYLRDNMLDPTGKGPVPDVAKMLIWSFLAGFAERIVPDTITRLTQILRSNDFGVDRRIMPGKFEDIDTPGKLENVSNADDIYSKLLKAQSEEGRLEGVKSEIAMESEVLEKKRTGDQAVKNEVSNQS